jgi:hypothetical protein
VSGPRLLHGFFAADCRLPEIARNTLSDVVVQLQNQVISSLEKSWQLDIKIDLAVLEEASDECQDRAIESLQQLHRRLLIAPPLYQTPPHSPPSAPPPTPLSTEGFFIAGPRKPSRSDSWDTAPVSAVSEDRWRDSGYVGSAGGSVRKNATDGFKADPRIVDLPESPSDVQRSLTPPPPPKDPRRSRSVSRGDEAYQSREDYDIPPRSQAPTVRHSRVSNLSTEVPTDQNDPENVAYNPWLPIVPDVSQDPRAGGQVQRRPPLRNSSMAPQVVEYRQPRPAPPPPPPPGRDLPPLPAELDSVAIHQLTIRPSEEKRESCHSSGLISLEEIPIDERKGPSWTWLPPKAGETPQQPPKNTTTARTTSLPPPQPLRVDHSTETKRELPGQENNFAGLCKGESPLSEMGGVFFSFLFFFLKPPVSRHGWLLTRSGRRSMASSDRRSQKGFSRTHASGHAVQDGALLQVHKMQL